MRAVYNSFGHHGKFSRNTSVGRHLKLSPTRDSIFKTRSENGGSIGANIRPYPSQIGDGLRPYELWKKQMVTKSGSINLAKGRQQKLQNEQTFKSQYFTQKSIQNKRDYIPMANVYHGKHLSVDPKHIDIDENIIKVMKTTTYSIGKKGHNAPNEVDTTNQTQLTEKLKFAEEKLDLDNPRRCDPENPNRIKTVGFGFGAEKGTYDHQFVHR